MRKLPYLLGTTAIALALAMPGTASAQSAKATGAAQVGSEIFGTGDDFGSGANMWADVPGLSASIKSPHGKELAIDVSLLCGAFTEAKSKSKEGILDTTSAGARIKVRVEIEPDPNGAGPTGYADPGGAAGVVFCDQQLTVATALGGVITNLSACTGTTITAACELTEEEVTIGLKLLHANAFNFFAIDLDNSDTYTLTVQAMLDTCKGSAAVTDTDSSIGDCIDDGNSDAKAFGFITGGSMFVEEVRFIQGDDL